MTDTAFHIAGHGFGLGVAVRWRTVWRRCQGALGSTPGTVVTRPGSLPIRERRPRHPAQHRSYCACPNERRYRDTQNLVRRRAHVALGLLTLPIINSTLTENEAVGQPPTVSRADSRTGRKTQTGRH